MSASSWSQVLKFRLVLPKLTFILFFQKPRGGSVHYFYSWFDGFSSVTSEFFLHFFLQGNHLVIVS